MHLIQRTQQGSEMLFFEVHNNMQSITVSHIFTLSLFVNALKHIH